jgi:hypothetical protein
MTLQTNGGMDEDYTTAGTRTPSYHTLNKPGVHLDLNVMLNIVVVTIAVGVPLLNFDVDYEQRQQSSTWMGT